MFCFDHYAEQMFFNFDSQKFAWDSIRTQPPSAASDILMKIQWNISNFFPLYLKMIDGQYIRHRWLRENNQFFVRQCAIVINVFALLMTTGDDKRLKQSLFSKIFISKPLTNLPYLIRSQTLKAIRAC